MAVLLALAILLLLAVLPGLAQTGDFWKASAVLLSMGLLYLITMLYLNSRKLTEQ